MAESVVHHAGGGEPHTQAGKACISYRVEKPKREGTAAHTRNSAYELAAHITEARHLGATWPGITNDFNRGLSSVIGVPSTEDPPTALPDDTLLANLDPSTRASFKKMADIPEDTFLSGIQKGLKLRLQSRD